MQMSDHSGNGVRFWSGTSVSMPLISPSLISPSRLPCFVALRLNRVRVSHAGLVHQIFEPPAGHSRWLLDFWRQFVRNVD